MALIRRDFSINGRVLFECAIYISPYRLTNISSDTAILNSSDNETTFNGGPFEDCEFWFRSNEIAAFLGFLWPRKAVFDYVDASFRRKWFDMPYHTKNNAWHPRECIFFYAINVFV